MLSLTDEAITAGVVKLLQVENQVIQKRPPHATIFIRFTFLLSFVRERLVLLEGPRCCLETPDGRTAADSA